MWQPWASLVVNINPKTGEAFKSIETRGQRTWKFDETILIYACKRWTPEQVLLCKSLYFEEAIDTFSNFCDMPRGVIIGAVDIVDCIPVEMITNMDAHEKAFGDYSPSRFGWILENPRLFEIPLPFSASQGWNKYTCPPDWIKNNINKQ